MAQRWQAGPGGRWIARPPDAKDVTAWVKRVVEYGLQQPDQKERILQLEGIEAHLAKCTSLDALCDGRLLCAFAISAVPSLATGRTGLAAYARLAFFQRFSRSLGVEDTSLFVPPDLYPLPSKRPQRLIDCLSAVGECLLKREDYTAPGLWKTANKPKDRDGADPDEVARDLAAQQAAAKQKIEKIFGDGPSMAETAKLEREKEIEMLKKGKEEEAEAPRPRLSLKIVGEGGVSTADLPIAEPKDLEDEEPSLGGNDSGEGGAPVPVPSAARGKDEEMRVYEGAADMPDYQMDSLPVFRGHLFKKSPSAWRILRSFERRFFIIRDMQIFWWKEQADAEKPSAKQDDGGELCKGVINLAAQEVIFKVDDVNSTVFMLQPKDKWAPGAYTGKSDARIYVFDADGSEYTRDEWTEAIYAHLSHARKVREQLGPLEQEMGSQPDGDKKTEFKTLSFFLS